VPSAAGGQHGVTLANPFTESVAVSVALALAVSVAVHERHPDDYGRISELGLAFAVRVIVGIRYCFAVWLTYPVWVGFSVVIRSHVHCFRDA
jgi:hypothetical protein